MTKKTAAAWQMQLKRKKDGVTLEPCAYNSFLIFANDARWVGVLAFDSMVGDLVALKPPPWTEDMVRGTPTAGRWQDTDTVLANLWLMKMYPGFTCTIANSYVGDALLAVGRKNCFHPVRDWLNGLVWDGVPRLDSWLSRAASVEDNEYTRAVASKFLIGAVSRAMVPGSKVDTMPVFEGEQGIGKSTLLRELCGEEWFLETGIELGGKDSYQILKGKWIVELSELDSLQRSEVSRVKAYVSARVDTYRPSYGRISANHPRCVVFAGTTNANEYLKDDSGARRFLPVRLGAVDLALVRAERDQLWAEAVARYRAGEAWHLEDETVRRLHAEITTERRQIDPWEHPVRIYLNGLSATERNRGLSTHRILTTALGIAQEKLTRSDEMRAGQVFRTLGWGKRVRVRFAEGFGWVYRPDGAIDSLPEGGNNEVVGTPGGNTFSLIDSKR